MVVSTSRVLRRILVIAACASVVFAMSGNAVAQGVTTGNLSGRVVDDQGGVLPGADVLAVHEPTGTEYTAVTEGDGRFRMLNVRVGGPYKVSVTMAGFRAQSRADVMVNLGEETPVDFTLHLETVQETVAEERPFVVLALHPLGILQGCRLELDALAHGTEEDEDGGAGHHRRQGHEELIDLALVFDDRVDLVGVQLDGVIEGQGDTATRGVGFELERIVGRGQLALVGFRATEEARQQIGLVVEALELAVVVGVRAVPEVADRLVRWTLETAVALPLRQPQIGVAELSYEVLVLDLRPGHLGGLVRTRGAQDGRHAGDLLQPRRLRGNGMELFGGLIDFVEGGIRAEDHDDRQPDEADDRQRVPVREPSS